MSHRRPGLTHRGKLGLLIAMISFLLRIAAEARLIQPWSDLSFFTNRIASLLCEASMQSETTKSGPGFCRPPTGGCGRLSAQWAIVFKFPIKRPHFSCLFRDPSLLKMTDISIEPLLGASKCLQDRQDVCTQKRSPGGTPSYRPRGHRGRQAYPQTNRNVGPADRAAVWTVSGAERKRGPSSILRD